MAEKFINQGFGWECIACSKPAPDQHSRLMTEGEAEDKVPGLSQSALAEWEDRELEILRCRECGVTEKIGLT